MKITTIKQNNTIFAFTTEDASVTVVVKGITTKTEKKALKFTVYFNTQIEVPEGEKPAIKADDDSWYLTAGVTWFGGDFTKARTLELGMSAFKEIKAGMQSIDVPQQYFEDNKKKDAADVQDKEVTKLNSDVQF